MPLSDAERGDVDRITATTRRALGERAFAVEFDLRTTLYPHGDH